MAIGSPRIYLADKSALVRFGHPDVSKGWSELLLGGAIATCPIIDLEVLYSARSLVDYESILVERTALPSFSITVDVINQALSFQHQLAKKGQHRIPIPDLLIAAVADINGLTVLHYDSDFERIADLSGQATVWLAEPGSL